MKARPGRGTRSLALLACALLLAPGPGRAADGAAVEAIDGDTLVVDGRHVQLAGIDAPELGQKCLQEGKLWPCGLEAARALAKLIVLGRVSCEDGGEKTAPLPAAVCRSGTSDLAEALLRQGYAVALPGGFPNYREAEVSAQKVPLGLWRGAFVAPAAWRAGARLPQETGDGAGEGCNIKTMLGPNGERIYLVPSDALYASVEIHPEKGERLFCSDEAARAAGWSERPPPKQPKQ